MNSSVASQVWVQIELDFVFEKAYWNSEFAIIRSTTFNFCRITQIYDIVWVASASTFIADDLTLKITYFLFLHQKHVVIFICNNSLVTLV